MSPVPHARKIARWNFTAARRTLVVGRLGELFDRAHGADRDGQTGVESMVDDPLRLPVHGVEHVEPAAVALRQHLEQRREQTDRLAVVFERLGLAQRTAQRGDGFGVAAARRAHEVLRGRAEPARLHERARRVAVERAPARRADPLVDRLLVERVRDLVEHLAPEVFFVHEAQAHELAQRFAERIEIAIGDVFEVAQLDAVAEHGDELDAWNARPHRAP